MKAAYVIVDTKIEDYETYEKYKLLAKPIVEKFGGEYLTRGGELHIEQSELWEPKRIVIVKFPSMSDAKKFHNSAEYEPVKSIRLGASKATLIIVEGT